MGKKLTTEEKQQIRRLYSEGYTYRDLAKQYGCSHPTIMRVVKNDIKIVKGPDPLPPPPPPPPRPNVTELAFISDPIQFRIQKLTEIFMDLDACRDARSMGPLTGLHKLQIDLHDQITALKKAAGEIDDDLNPQEMILQFEQAFLSLPPLVKDQLIDLFVADTSNIVSIREKS